MTALIPNRFLFSFEFPLRYRSRLPAVEGGLADWTDADLLPKLGELDASPADSEGHTTEEQFSEFADVWACWNETGIAIACRVGGKRKALRCEQERFWAGDNLRLCTDMRDSRSVKRATRYCQQFCFLPTGGGAKGKDPVALVNKIKRAREDAPPVPVELIRVASHVTKSGYSMAGFIPGECLSGFEPAEHPRIGFYYILEDSEHGQQYLTVGDDLYWYVDPSTWATAVLMKTSKNRKIKTSKLGRNLDT